MASAGAVGASLQEARDQVQDSELAIEEAAGATNSSMYGRADLMMTYVVSAWYGCEGEGEQIAGLLCWGRKVVRLFVFFWGKVGSLCVGCHS